MKGIYHELLFVQDYNATHGESYAEMFNATNHAGADIMIKDRDSDEVLHEIQLKATENASYVSEHIARYPGIEVRATDEVSANLDDVVGTGILNEEITRQVDADLELEAANTITDQAIESAGLIGIIAAGRQTIEVLQGRKTARRAAISTGSVATAGAAATWIAAFLFS